MNKIIFFIYCFIIINSISIPEENLKKSNLLNIENNDLQFDNDYSKKTAPHCNKYNIKNNNETGIINLNGYFNLASGTLPLFNSFHICFSFLLFPLIAIILIICDLKEDKKFLNLYNLTTKEKAKEEYKLLKTTFILRGKYLFSWFIMKYEYPITNIFFLYSYNHLRYIRFMISIIKIFFNLLIVSIFLEKINIDDSDILKYLLLSIIISLIMQIVYELSIKIILEYDKKRRNIIKPKLEILRKYVYYVIKNDILFNSKWHLIRNRMITYYRICGQSILKKNKKNKNNKYERYVTNKLRNTGGNLSEVIKSLNSSVLINKDEEKNYNGNNGFRERVSSSNSLKSNLGVIKTEIINKQNKIILKNIDNSNLYITKGVEPFSFSRFGVNNVKLKTLKKFEYIKNKYIKNKNTIIYDETLEVNSNVKTFDNLYIESLENYTYISTDAIIHKLNRLNSNSNKMIKNILTNVILLIILILVNIGLVLFSLYKIENGDKFETNDKLLFQILCILLIIDFFIYRGKCLLIAFSISNLYGKKKRNCCYKMIFDLLIEKYIRYFYRMRLFINKYSKEFNFMEI